MNNKFKITLEAPLLRPGLKIETMVSEGYLVAGVETVLDKVREINGTKGRTTVEEFEEESRRLDREEAAIKASTNPCVEIERGRQTGRTSRMLLECALAASNGYNCVVIMHTHVFARDARQHFEKLLDSLHIRHSRNGDTVWMSNKSGNFIKFYGFEGTAERLQGSYNLKTQYFVDHYVWDWAQIHTRALEYFRLLDFIQRRH